RRRMEIGVAQTIPGNPVKRRRRNYAAECAGHAVAGVVRNYQQDVRRALWRHDARRPIGFRFRRLALDLAAEFLRRSRKLVAGNGGGGARRTRYTHYFLCSRRGYCKEKG